MFRTAHSRKKETRCPCHHRIEASRRKIVGKTQRTCMSIWDTGSFLRSGSSGFSRTSSWSNDRPSISDSIPSSPVFKLVTGSPSSSCQSSSWNEEKKTVRGVCARKRTGKTYAVVRVYVWVALGRDRGCVPTHLEVMQEQLDDFDRERNARKLVRHYVKNQTTKKSDVSVPSRDPTMFAKNSVLVLVRDRVMMTRQHALPSIFSTRNTRADR